MREPHPASTTAPRPLAAGQRPPLTGEQDAATAAAVPRQTLTYLRVGPVEGWAMAVSAVYLLAAVVLVGWLRLPAAEAIARTAHLGSLFDGFSTSPAAFGLERPPLPTMLALPFGWIPAFREDGLAVALGTAAVGGGGVMAAYGLAKWAGFARLPAAVYVLAFALHPLLLFSGATGLPEALYATLLLAGFGQFLRWLDRETTAPVIGAGAALGAAFLVRYDSLWVAAALALAFWWVASHRGAANGRADRGQAAALAFMVPVLFTAGLWILLTWFAQGDLLEFYHRAADLSALAANDREVASRMAELTASPTAVASWIGRWAVVVATPSTVAVGALAAWGALRRDAEALVLAAVLAAVLLPEVVSLLSGHGQPHVPHLFAFIVPAFVALAYAERRRAGRVTIGQQHGRLSGRQHRRRQRRQLLSTVLLATASLATLAVLPALPRTDAPAAAVLERLWRGEPAAQPAAVAQAAAWVLEHADAGDVIVDGERVGAVMVATGAFDRFHTAADRDAAEVLEDPLGRARYLLVRETISGAAPGRVQREYRGLHEAGGPWVDLAFEARPYRIYRVDDHPPPPAVQR